MTETHLNSGQFIRALDDELTPAEAMAVESHLDSCDACRMKLREFGVLSANIEGALLGISVDGADAAGWRAEVAGQLRSREKEAVTPKSSRFWYSGVTAGVLAASLALVLLVPSLTHPQPNSVAMAPNATTLQVAGETFIALPYSNSDVSPIAPRIVEMQVPVSSLMSAGVVFEPISSLASDPDRSVRADVLLGADGEPLGVHVLNWE